MSGPRVLVLGAVLGQPPGGVRRHNAELLPRLAERLAAAGGELCVLEGTRAVAFPLPPSVRRIASSVPPSPPLVRATLEGRWTRRVLREAALADRPFDLVHTGHLPVPRHLPVPHTVTIHDLRALELAHTPMSRRLLARGIVGRAVETAAAVITVSETVRASLLQRFRLAPERVHVVPNAADHFTPLPRAVAGDAPLLHVGHLEPRKNVELLLRALAHDPSLPDLLLAGAAKGDEERRLRALAAELGGAGRVRFHGPFDEAELPALYARAAAVVLPSRLEGFGIAALEAQRARVPLAVAAAGALPEVAGEGVPTFPPDDPAACATAIHAALATGPAELDAHARRAARSTWAASADRWLTAWRAALPS